MKVGKWVALLTAPAFAGCETIATRGSERARAGSASSYSEVFAEYCESLYSLDEARRICKAQLESYGSTYGPQVAQAILQSMERQPSKAGVMPAVEKSSVVAPSKHAPGQRRQGDDEDGPSTTLGTDVMDGIALLLSQYGAESDSVAPRSQPGTNCNAVDSSSDHSKPSKAKILGVEVDNCHVPLEVALPLARAVLDTVKDRVKEYYWHVLPWTGCIGGAKPSQAVKAAWSGKHPWGSAVFSRENLLARWKRLMTTTAFAVHDKEILKPSSFPWQDDRILTPMGRRLSRENATCRATRCLVDRVEERLQSKNPFLGGLPPTRQGDALEVSRRRHEVTGWGATSGYRIPMKLFGRKDTWRPLFSWMVPSTSKVLHQVASSHLNPDAVKGAWRFGLARRAIDAWELKQAKARQQASNTPPAGKSPEEAEEPSEALFQW